MQLEEVGRGKRVYASSLDDGIDQLTGLGPRHAAMEIPDDADGLELLELQRFAAASVAFFRSSSAEMQPELSSACAEMQEDTPETDTLSLLEGASGEAEEPLSCLLTQAKAFQFFFALQEAQQRVEEAEHASEEAATNARTTELETTARGAVASAIQTYVLHSVDGAPSSETQGTTAATALRPAVNAPEGTGQSDISIEPAAAGGDVPASFQDVTLVSDTEIEAWKWEALSGDSEAPTDTEGYGSTRAENMTSTNETYWYGRSGVENGSSTNGQDRVIGGHSASWRKRTEAATRPRPETTETDETNIHAVASNSSLPSKADVYGRCAEAEMVPFPAATSEVSKVCSVDQKHDAVAREPQQPKYSERKAQEQAIRDKGRHCEVVGRFRAEAAERQSLFALSAGGVRRRRGRRDQKLTGSHRVEGSASREAAIGNDEDEDVTGQLLGLAQEMKVEATRYGEVLQRDNERLQRTGEAQQLYLDDTEASATQTRSFIRGTGFGFLYGMILLIITCALFVCMLFFILFVRG